MKEINKYWYIHGWCSFFKLDEKTHDLAIQEIWEWMTSNASIYYHKPLSTTDKENIKFDLKVISKSRSSVLIQWQISKKWEEFVTWMFTFVKIKK